MAITVEITPVEPARVERSYTLRHKVWNFHQAGLEMPANFPNSYYCSGWKRDFVPTDKGRRTRTSEYRLTNRFGGCPHLDYWWRLMAHVYVKDEWCTLGSLRCAGGPRDVPCGRRLDQAWILPERLQGAVELKLVCTGAMPAPIFADWLQEEYDAIPDEHLMWLRGWAK